MANFKVTTYRTAEQVVEENRAQRQREREQARRVWEESPEGKAEIARQLEQQQQHEEARRLQEMEAVKRSEWNSRCSDIERAGVAVGTVFENVTVWCSIRDDKPSAMSRMVIVPGVYPDRLPYWTLDSKARYGIVSFLSYADAQEVQRRLNNDWGDFQIRKVRVIGYGQAKRSAQLKVVEW